MTQGMMAAHCKIPDQMDDGLLLAKLLNFCSVLSAMVDFFLPQYRTWYSCSIDVRKCRKSDAIRMTHVRLCRLIFAITSHTFPFVLPGAAFVSHLA